MHFTASCNIWRKTKSIWNHLNVSQVYKVFPLECWYITKLTLRLRSIQICELSYLIMIRDMELLTLSRNSNFFFQNEQYKWSFLSAVQSCKKSFYSRNALLLKKKHMVKYQRILSKTFAWNWFFSRAKMKSFILTLAYIKFLSDSFQEKAISENFNASFCSQSLWVGCYTLSMAKKSPKYLSVFGI